MISFIDNRGLFKKKRGRTSSEIRFRQGRELCEACSVSLGIGSLVSC